MPICSLEFLITCCGIVILLHLLPLLRLRQSSFAIVNAMFLIPFVPNLQSWLWFGGFLALTYLALAIVRARPSPWIVWPMIVVIVVLFIYVKQYSFVPMVLPVELWWHAWVVLGSVQIIGLSYMLFKFIHMLVDEWQGQLAPFSLLSYLNYQLAFFTLLAGPIQRYNDFQRGWQQMDLGPGDASQSWAAWSRILSGLLKMQVLAPLAQWAFDIGRLHLHPADHGRLQDVALYFYAYPVQLYFNFSGYTDVAIGTGRLLGFQLPENFNRPYIARNVLDFWDRWHMSLTAWVRTYVFMTSYKAAAMRWPQWSRYWGYVLIFLALFIIGLWHGTTSGFVVFGLLNGLGAVVNRAYGDALRSVLGRAGMERYLQSRLIRVAAIVVTFHYVCFCHVFFSTLEVSYAWDIFEVGVREILHFRAAIAVAAWLAAVFAAAGVASWLSSTIQTSGLTGRFAFRWPALTARTTAWPQLAVCFQLAVVVVIFCFTWAARQQPPPVVYMRF